MRRPPAASASEPLPGGAAAARLDYRTKVDGTALTPVGPIGAIDPKVQETAERSAAAAARIAQSGAKGAMVRLIDYGAGNVELVAFIPTEARKRGREIWRELSPAEREENQRRAVQRARTEARRRVMCAGLDHLLTLTTRQAVIDPNIAWQMWGRFVRLIRDDAMLAEYWPYVAVLEWQRRGALHWHAAVRGKQNVNRLRRQWLKVISEFEILGGGNIDVQYRRGRDNIGMARYLAKYIGKELDADITALGGHRYRASLGISVPIYRVRVTWRDLREAIEGVAHILELSLPSILSIRDDGVTHAVWACSWGRDRSLHRTRHQDRLAVCRQNEKVRG